MNSSDLHSATADRAENTENSLLKNTGTKAASENGETREDKETKSYTAAQKEVADRAHEIIMANLERHITIAEFSQELHASATQVKVCFHKVYGVPIYSYARARRMEAAARLLSETDDSILEIAGKFGYENGSKFARAFRMVMGLSPSEYRKRVLWERENCVFSKNLNEQGKTGKS